ncbi:MAG: bacillithiol system redox-active protein YtxJ [Bacteroidia bacterium]
MDSWRFLQDEAQLSEISEASYIKPQLIFKHSTTCGISAQAHHVLMESTDSLSDFADLYYLDLLRYRPISNRVAAELNVPHQSPQIIVVKDGQAVYNSSHFAINPKAILSSAS